MRSQRHCAVIGAFTAVCVAVAAATLGGGGPGVQLRGSGHPTLASEVASANSMSNCIYPSSSQQLLSTYEQLTGLTYSCVLLYNNAKPTWSNWVSPWFQSPPTPDSNWVSWKNAEPGRRLIISQPMVPDDAPSNWRILGAQGAYDQYATQLAENLVADGLGNSIIRLGWEANDPYGIENELGSDPSQYADWAEYWAQIVRSMRAIPGADFEFDWTVNQYYQPIPLADWYPGNDVVDIIGIDAYDSGVAQTANPVARWNTLVNEPDGLNAVAAFARANGKPISIPEWGLVEPGAAEGDGDDPTYVQGLANFIRSNDVAYNSYFVGGADENLDYLPQAPNSLAAYASDFQFASGTITPPVSSALSVVGAEGLVSEITAAGSRTTSSLSRLTAPIVGIASTPDLGGYWLDGADGGVFAYGDARFLGSTGDLQLAKPVVGMAATPDGGGYWLVASDGGVFAFGDARFFGSTGSLRLAKPVVGMAATPDGGGYELVASDGGIFSFGDNRFYGSAAGTMASPASAIVPTGDGSGYWIVSLSGRIQAFGDAWSVSSSAPGDPVVGGAA